jgi:hypothetical protein
LPPPRVLLPKGFADHDSEGSFPGPARSWPTGVPASLAGAG